MKGKTKLAVIGAHDSLLGVLGKKVGVLLVQVLAGIDLRPHIRGQEGVGLGDSHEGGLGCSRVSGVVLDFSAYQSYQG